MTNQQQPITPPPELVQQLRRNAGTWLEQITIAYQAGADQELKACCKWIKSQDWTWTVAQLCAARRPKPPSLKKQALALLDMAEDPCQYINNFSIVRQAIEELPDD
jgi:hypothetical protein